MMAARFALFLLLMAGAALGKAPSASNAPTFNRDVAPIVFANCVVCHHPGGIGPFSLTSFAEVKKRAKLIARVTASRFMPPWMPEHGHGEFVGERRLSDEQIAMIDRWWKAGAPQGAPGDLKVKAEWSDDWQLGKPDLVVTLPEPFPLPAAGKDVYRNFVIPNVVGEDRFLRATEFRPGTTGAIHHAFVLIDDSGGARRRDAAEPGMGFPGMDAAGAQMPDAMFTSWQPGKRPSEAPEGAATLLRKGTDLVIQLHMRPTGKTEKVQPSIALYFADRAPTRSPTIVLLRSVNIDIPPGQTDYAIESSYQLPVDVDVVAILPHLHYLGREVHGWADLPDGSQKELILIKQWDFNWQGDYRYRQPLELPKGSVLRMRFTYDNSAANSRNPNQPPQRVTYGLQSSDEMGELWLQMFTHDPAERGALARDLRVKHELPDSIAWASAMVRLNPKDAERRADLGAALAVSGRIAEAVQALEQAIADNPNIARAHHVLGQIAMSQEDAAKAKAALGRAAALDPEDAATQNDLGWVLFATGDLDGAIEHLEKAVTINPSDALARKNLERARAARRSR
jgi:Flp pilus assembly protein TadD